MAVYSKAELNALGIYELRSVARAIGVKSPTTKKFDDLVECILKIQNGEEKAVSTNKGRPPKTFGFDFNLPNDKLAKPLTYAEDMPDFLASKDIVIGVNKEYFKCYGVIKQNNGNYYLLNYCNGLKNVQVPAVLIQKHNLCAGDFVFGQAYELIADQGVLQDIYHINFNNKPNGTTKLNSYLQNYEEPDTIYKSLENNEENRLNIVLQLEASWLKTKDLLEKNVFICSRLRDDIARSYNTLVDAKYLIEMLSQKEIAFTLHLIDVDYIYMIMDIYCSNVFGHKDVESGEYIKNILLNILESKCGNVIVYARNDQCRNSYLDAILKRYLNTN